jgi:hypothetical protein
VADEGSVRWAATHTAIYEPRRVAASDDAGG